MQVQIGKFYTKDDDADDDSNKNNFTMTIEFLITPLVRPDCVMKIYWSHYILYFHII